MPTNVVRLNVRAKTKICEAAQVEIVLFEKRGGPLTKDITKDRGGKLHKDSSRCCLSRGTATRHHLSLNEFADLIEDIRPNQAIALGALRADLPDKVLIGTKEAIAGGAVKGAVARSADNISYKQGPALALLDIDGKGMPSAVARQINAAGGIVNAITSIVPDMASAAYVKRRSTSAGIIDTNTGDVLSKGGDHIFVLVTDGSDVERFLKHLHERGWLLGYGWYIVGACGQLLERSIIDRAVFGGERLVFEASPELGAGLAQKPRRAFVHSGQPLDTHTACPPLTTGEQNEVKRRKTVAAKALESKCRDARAAWESKQVDRLIRRGVTQEAARLTVQKLAGGTLTPEALLEFDDPNIGVVSCADVLADPKHFDGETLADPIEGRSLGKCKAKLFVHGDGSIIIHSFIHGGCNFKIVDDVSNAEPGGATRKDKDRSQHQTDDDWTLQSQCVADVDMKNVVWLWPQHLALKKVTIIAGDPGLGKSMLTADIAARVSKGFLFPGSESRRRPANVVFLAAEDSVEDTLRPRLEAADADVRRCHVIKMLKSDKGCSRMFALGSDLDKLANEIERIGNVALVIIDPISAYLGDADSHRISEVAPLMNALADFAERTNCAVLVIHHPPKGQVAKAIHAFSGSLAFSAGPRFVFVVAPDQAEDGRRLLLIVKCSVGLPPAGIGYRVLGKTVEAKDGVLIDAARIEWDREPVMVTATEAMRGETKTPKLQEAIDFLLEELADGPMLESEVRKLASFHGIADKTLRNAKEKIGIASVKDGFAGKWMWSVPVKKDAV